MKRSFSTLSCLESDMDTVINDAKALSLQGVELRVGSDLKTLKDLSIIDAERIKTAFGNAKLTITDLALSAGVTGYFPDAVANIKEGIDFAQKTGANAVRIFVGKPWTSFSQKPDIDYEGIVDAFRELCDYSDKCEIWLETHSIFSSGESIADLIKRIDRPNVFALWDIIHTLEAHEKISDTVKFLGKYIRHVHIKDGIPQENKDAVQYIHTDLSKGSVPVKEAIAELQKINYSGFYSLEWESPWRPEIHNLYPDHRELLKSFVSFTETK